MKISHKMILLFSTMLLLLVVMNTASLNRASTISSDASTADRYHNMAVNMVHNMEQFITMMDLAIEDITSDTAFMEAFYQVVMGDEDDSAAMLSNQNKMFQSMYHSPIAEIFYRVCVYAENGYYLSSHIDRNSSIISLSDESREMIASIPYLKAVRGAPYRRHLIVPHRDYFNVAQEVQVFSAVHAVTWHGEHVGYIEVSAKVNELDQLLITDNKDVMVRATFSDGSILYASPEDEAIYDEVPLNAFVAYIDPTSIERNVYHTQSRWLGLDIYLAEDAAIRYRTLSAMTAGYVQRSLGIFLAVLALVIVLSLSLTNSIRRLNRRVRNLPVDHLMLSPDTSQLTECVTSPRDKEIHELEASFNEILLALHDVTRSEMSMRESALHTRLKALQAQINPHFVYNTLNIISAKGMESGNEDIVNMCDQFAQMLRYSTDTRFETATLGEDLHHVHNYLRLLKARYETHLEYRIAVPEALRALIIPKLTLQPLVENAITHGFEGSDTEVRRVEISGTVREDRLCLEIRDNGRGFSPQMLSQLQRDIAQIEQDASTMPDTQGHIGLMNTCLRLHYYSKGAMHMELMNDRGAVVRLTMELSNDYVPAPITLS